MNNTVNLPAGATNHGNPDLLCLPTEWSDILIFLVTNYFAHAATVFPEPGVGYVRNIALVLTALVLPGSGVRRGVTAIWRHAATETSNEAKRAARAHALCMVMKVPRRGPYATALKIQRQWNQAFEDQKGAPIPVTSTARWLVEKIIGIPHRKLHLETTAPQQQQGDNAEEAPEREPDEEQYPATETLSADAYPGIRRLHKPFSGKWWENETGYEPVPPRCSISGEYWLSEEYYLATVPHYAELELEHQSHDFTSTGARFMHQQALLPSSYNAPQLLVSLGQTLWATLTIYEARGDQLQIYGYAAFGLTVVPYALMSLVNGVASLLTPQYSTMFIIRTPAMNEAEERRHGAFCGVLEVKLTEIDEKVAASEPTHRAAQLYVSLLLAFIPLAIVGALSRFRNGESSSLQRGFTLSWLVIGALYGAFIQLILPQPDVERHPSKEERKRRKDARREESDEIFDGYETSVPDLYLIYLALIFASVAIGGMVIVAIMIKDYGNCSLIS